MFKKLFALDRMRCLEYSMGILKQLNDVVHKTSGKNS